MYVSHYYEYFFYWSWLLRTAKLLISGKRNKIYNRGIASTQFFWPLIPNRSLEVNPLHPFHCAPLPLLSLAGWPRDPIPPYLQGAPGYHSPHLASRGERGYVVGLLLHPQSTRFSWEGEGGRKDWKAVPPIPRHPVEAGEESTLAPLLLPTKGALRASSFLKALAQVLSTALFLCGTNTQSKKKKIKKKSGEVTLLISKRPSFLWLMLRGGHTTAALTYARRHLSYRGSPQKGDKLGKHLILQSFPSNPQ